MRALGCCVILIRILVYVNGKNGDTLMLPNERTSLDDCHLRFHLMHVENSVKPAFGHPARLKEFAHMGALGWTQLDGSTNWRCGGTLIWDNFVLTAAHCTIDGSNKAPDVVRFGDLDLSSSKDDKYAQQLRIVEIIRYPEHRFTGHYHDIALLRLEKNVTLHDTVVPACLWTDDEIRFKILEATGWGRTGFAEDQTPVLLKVALKPIENDECNKIYTNVTDRKLRSGLHDHHICAVDEKMDTCEGDSGGPLQIKLMHNGRVTPFLVAITSFGMTCGTSLPGVYTKVAPYLSWIIDVMQKRGTGVDDDTYNATLCAIRYSFFREYEDAVITSRSDDYVAVDSDLKHMFMSSLPSYVVKLNWYSGGHNNCYGILIDENTVLTIASCATHNGLPVSTISYKGNNYTDVSEVIIHPGYVHGTSYNNIAILRLEEFVDAGQFQPSCIWDNYQLPVKVVEVFGSGRRDINSFLYMGVRAVLDPTVVTLAPRADIQNATACMISKRFLPQLQRGLTSEHICTGNNIFLVPDSCELKIGGPLRTTTHRFGNTYPMSIGLNQFGRDCGFGEHSIATGFARHAEWLKSVLLPNYREPSGALLFLDTDRHEGDSCSSEDGKAARCVPISMCLQKWKKLFSDGSTRFCSTSSVVCCPVNEIQNGDGDGIHRELADCPKIVKKLKPRIHIGSQVFIGWTTGRSISYECIGAIITKSIILTSASCLGDKVPHVVGLISNDTDTVFEVDASLTHYGYNSTDGTNDIALVRLRETLDWSSDVFPSCLWTNTTHLPLRTLYAFGDGRGSMTFLYAHPMYNSDCQRKHPYTIQNSQICAKQAARQPLCAYEGDQLRWETPDRVSYVVGLATSSSNCDNWSYSVFTRVSSFVTWIDQAL